MIPAILKLDAGGIPVAWIRWQSAVTLYARDRVCWEAGAERFTIYGGRCAATGQRSIFEIGSIIAVADRSRRFASGVPLLTNRTLFQRDRNLCLYCGLQFAHSALTRDHVVPASRGGGTIWENCVTACARYPLTSEASHSYQRGISRKPAQRRRQGRSQRVVARGLPSPARSS